MRAVIQRVSSASVSVNGSLTGSISAGLLVLLGISEQDQQEDAEWLVAKIAAMRVFNDSEGKMNLSLHDIQGSILLISQFTLFASTKKGNRPSFIQAAKPEIANPLYEYCIELCKNREQIPTQTGIFGADMQVELVNDGPVTIFIDSKNKE
jgi:D-tyrosyl-tRNA(Tyr) deacylase